MDEYQALISVVSLTMGVSWASGVNLYAALLVLGLGGITGNIDLPPDLEALQNPLVIFAAGVMYAAEFLADKIPGLDSTWDALHTFIRIPAGVMLAAGVVGDVSPALEIAAGIMGGGLAATSHATKAGTRLVVNTSPEPFSNWGLSIAEDLAVFAGLWAALTHPVVFIALIIIFLLLTIWLLPRLWAGVKFLFRKLGQLFGIRDFSLENNEVLESTSSLSTSSDIERRLISDRIPVSDSQPSTDIVTQLEKLKALLDSGAISTTEYEKLKAKLTS
ncbi:MAG: DUF4126 family protein [Pseudomonadales bacterium]|nr:DUF4126 family protein [Pseudomonadales bacterium]